MNILRISIFTLTLSLITFSCTESTENTANSTTETVEDIMAVETIAKNVNASEFQALIEKGGFLLDVRTPGELAEGSIEGNTNININSPSFKSEIEKLDKNVPVFVYCRSGGRSGKAMGIMKDLGFKEVYNLNGGYSGWPNK